MIVSKKGTTVDRRPLSGFGQHAAVDADLLDPLRTTACKHPKGINQCWTLVI